MSNLFDIGKTGLNAYRQSLAVTGQNIANINTDGYKRREAGLQEISAGTGSVTGIQNQTGIGVRITGIRRSFDEFLLNKARSATASAEAKSALYASLRQLEDTILPGDSNLGNSIGQFFSSLQEVVTSPSDVAPRVVALEQAKLLADSFNDLSAVIDQLKQGLVTQANQEVDTINMLAIELGELNQQIAAAGKNKVNNALLDRRDALVDQMTESVGMSVDLGKSGAAGLTIGDSGRGPTLVEANVTTPIGIEPKDDLIAFVVSPGVANNYTSQVKTGALAGLADAYATVASVMNEIDQLAFKLVQDLNVVHRQGLDMDGLPGKNIFQDIDLNVQPNPTNVGDVKADIKVHDYSLLSAEKVTISYDKTADLWRGKNEAGDTVASGRRQIDFAGFTINFAGSAEDFDQFIIDPVRGSASGVAVSLKRPQDFAAASPLLVSASATNSSDAQIEAVKSEIYNSSGLPKVEDIFSNDGLIVSATQFLTGGPVSVIPADVTSIDLFSLVQQSNVKFGLGEADLLSASHLSLKVTTKDAGGNDVTDEIRFTLDQSNYNQDSRGWRNMDQIADLLNVGSLTGTRVSDASSVTLSQLGGFASGQSGNLTISLSEDAFAACGIELTTGRTVSGVVTGRIERGKVNVGEEIEIVGIKDTQKTTCTGVEMFRKLLDEGVAGDNVGVLLRGTKREEVERGQVLCVPGSIKPHTKFECEVYVLSKDEGGRHTPFFGNYRPQFYFRTTDVTGAIELPKDVEMVMPGDNVKMNVELITPIALEAGLKFAIREGGKTVGAGVVSKIVE